MTKFIFDLQRFADLSNLGKEGDIYLISNATELQIFADYVNAGNDCENMKFKLTDDIKLSSDSWTSIVGSEGFKGTFDGDGHKISGLTITDEVDVNCQGLFGYVNGGTIQNLNLTDVKIDCTYTGEYGSYVGAITGLNYGGTVSDCSVSGAVTGSGNMAMVGGIAGYSYGGTVSDCTSAAEVSGTEKYTGSLVGVNFNGTVSGYYYGSDPVGTNQGGNTDDVTRIYKLTLPAGATVDEDDDNVAYYDATNNVVYAAAKDDGTEITFNYSGAYKIEDENVTENEDGTYSYKMTAANAEISLGDINLQKDGDGVYLISNADELKIFAAYVNTSDDGGSGKTFKLTDDIKLSKAGNWTPIGSGSTAFKGTFDGGDHTISGLTIDGEVKSAYQGLFGTVGSGGTIQNLNLTDVNIDCKYNNGIYVYVGAVVGLVEGGTVSDCTVTGTGTVSGSGNYAKVGGIAGEIYESGKVSGCSVSGSVTGSGTVSEVGGIAGGNGDIISEDGTISDGTIENCTSTATVNGSASDEAYIGGVAGGNYSKISDCTVSGSVNGESEDAAYIGGIVGFGYDGTVSDCSVTGSVNGKSEDEAYIGGITGFGYGGTVSDCSVTGSVKGESEDEAYIGGVAGLSSDGTISNCSVSGTVTGESEDTAYIGGITGLSADGTISNCSVTGSVKGESEDTAYIGGITGLSAGGKISDCTVSSSVSGESEDAACIGGVAGLSSDGTISDCTVSGSVSGSASDEAYIGGIAGVSADGTIEKCTSVAKVSSDSDDADKGSLVGYNDGDVSGYYYGSDIEPVGTDEGGTVTATQIYKLTLPEGVTVSSGEAVTVDDETYCTAEVTLKSTAGKIKDATENEDGTYSLTLSEDTIVEVEPIDDDSTKVDNGIKYNKKETSVTLTSAFKGHTLTEDDYGSEVEVINASKISRSLEIYGNDNDNSIRGGKGRNTLDGGIGDDTLTGGKSSNLFVWSAGDDLITNYTESDKIYLSDATIDDDDIDVNGKNLTFNFDGGSLTVKNGVGKKITFVDEDGKKVTNIFDATAKYDKNKTSATLVSDFDGTFSASKTVKKIDGTKTDSAIKIVGNTLNNSISGGSGDDTLDGGKGNDTLTGGDGSNVFIWSAGIDVVTDYDEDDSIKISGVTKSMVSDGNVKLYVGDKGSMKILDGEGKKITFVDDSGDTDTKIFLPKMTFDGDQTAVTLASNYYGTFDASDYDALETIDASAEIYHSLKLYGNDNDNLIIGGQHADTLSGGDGDDTLTGGKGNDKFVWTAGDDEITDYSAGDKISLSGATLDIEKISVNGKDIEITLDGGSLKIDDALGKKISITDEDGSHNYIFDETAVYNLAKTSATLLSATNSFTAPDSTKVIDGSLVKASGIHGNALNNSISGGKGNDSLYGGDGNDKLYGGDGNDTLWGDAGNDSLYGGAGKDVFAYSTGDGNDTIFDYEKGDMLLILGDTEPTERFVGNDLVLSTDGGSITIKDFANSGETSVNMKFINTSTSK